MNASSFPRRVASLAAAAALLAAGSARADGPAPVAAPYAAGYAPPPAGYLPYPAPFVYAPPMQLTPYTPMKRRSPARMGAGIALLAIGSIAILAGTTMAIAGAQSGGYDVITPCSFGDCYTMQQVQPGLIAAGIVTLVLGSASLAAGIPLLVSGMRKVPDADARLLPEIGAGARSGSLTWRF